MALLFIKNKESKIIASGPIPLSSSLGRIRIETASADSGWYEDYSKKNEEAGS